MKMWVMQISQWIEDLSWRNMQAATLDNDAHEDDPGPVPGDVQDIIATQGPTVNVKVDSRPRTSPPRHQRRHSSPNPNP